MRSDGDVLGNDARPWSLGSLSLSPSLLSRLFLPAILLTLGACATAPTAGESDAGRQLGIEGTVVKVDTDPWAYDGNAVVTVDTEAGRVEVQFPARWNLCKARPPGDLQTLKPGDRVLAVGTASAPGQMVVCEQPQHLLRKVD